MKVVVMEYLSHPCRNGKRMSLSLQSFDFLLDLTYKRLMIVIGKCLWPRLRKNLRQNQIHPGR
jgi:hypothetical protein